MPDKRSPRVRRALVRLFPIVRAIFRVRFEGLDRIPDRPCLLVANHSIGVIPEVWSLVYAWEKRFDFRGDHPAYGLAHPFPFRIPGVRRLMEGAGAIPADYPDAREAFASGASVLVFPGGNWEATRPFRAGNAVDFDGHRGWIRVAKESQVDVVPVSISGSYRLNPVLFRSRGLAKLLLLDRGLRIRWLPVTLGQCFWTALFLAFAAERLPWFATLPAAWLVFSVSVLVPIFPGRLTVRFGEPLSSTAAEDALYNGVQTRIRSMFG
ncbi:MAG: 1-acyl-sn-glycerol-3-phosphate acyltransferase [Bdellovibrionales bacterium]|nr:1-acyl-sn-glycerol-3-phosphate acyltransferase [Bdellovibrionales bacterium]